MARNVEIKARIRDLPATRRLVATVAGGEPVSLRQTDTFFHVAAGRLKLRDTSGAEAELIHYARPDTPDPAQSRYRRVAVPDPRRLRALLAAALGVRGEVRKRRLLYLVGRTRVHLDAVEGLGTFLELEVVLREGEAVDAGVREARRLMRRLEIGESALVPEAYVDLIGHPARPRGARAAGKRGKQRTT